MSVTGSSDKNLLFGLLALQTDFVTQTQLIEAMNAWLLEKATPLGDVLVRRGAMSEDDRAAVAQRMDDGGASLAPATAPPTSHPSAGRGSGPASGTGPMRYRRLRPHARGGLGEVSVARDEELGREVALKEIQGRFADDADSRTRFVREAQVTGHLEHPGIVPVYGLGAHADGRPYYAMRFIKGESMHEAIARFHKAGGRRDGERRLALRELLGRFVAVCDAVAYAHSRSIIHRDLKPANVMLGEFGETLVVDWGLARLLDKADPEATASVALSASGSGSATALGQAVGTPAYLPPEQARGDHDKMGPASDVFSLGAILYQVLTGVPPHDGEDVRQVMDAAKKGDVAPARQRKKDVPRALDAVCAKALAALPEQRYDGAKALAADVRRWLADEPVSAYREPVVDRARRWGRRHRSVVSAGVMLLVVGVVALSVGLWAVNRERTKTAEALGLEEIARGEAEDNLKRALKAEKDAKANLAQAEANLKLARTAIDECYNVADKDPLFQQPRMKEAKKLLFKKTLPFYKKFRAQRPDDPRIQFEEALQWARVAHVERMLGNEKDAREASETALRAYAALVKAHPDVARYRSGLGDAHNNRGVVLMDQGRHEHAQKEYEAARAIRAALSKAHPDVSEYQNALASAHNNLGNLLSDQGKREQAQKEHEAAREIRAALVRTHPDVSEYRSSLASTHNNLGNLLSSLGRREQAQKEHEAARKIRVVLVRTYPNAPEHQQSLGDTYSNIGALLVDQGKREQAQREYEATREIRAALAKAHPDVPEYQNALASAHNNLGNLLSDQGKREQAQKEHEAAREIRAALVRTHPDVSEYRSSLASTHNNLGNLLAAWGRREQARRDYAVAHKLCAALVKAHPGVPEYRSDLAKTHENIGALLSDEGKREQARREYEMALEIRAALAKGHPDVPRHQRELATTHNNLGVLLSDLGHAERAQTEYEKARDVYSALAEAHPDVPENQSGLAATLNNLGAHLLFLGKREEAQKEYKAARALYSALAKAHPDLPEYQKGLGITHGNLGSVLSEQGRRGQAQKEYEAARNVFTVLVKAYPNVIEYKEALAQNCVIRGSLLFLLNRNDLRNALADFDLGVSVTDQLLEMDPKNQTAPVLLSVGLPVRAIVLDRLGRRSDADADWDRLLALTPAAQRGAVRLQRADSRARAGDYLRAAAYVAEQSDNDTLSGPRLYDLARIQSLNAHHAVRDAARPLPEREKRAETYAKDAIVLMKRAKDVKFFADPRQVEHAAKDDDLAPLRQRDDFRAFLAALKPK